jgi:hypothetical protein
MLRNTYKNIKDFGNTQENLESNDPLSYCLNWTLDQQFLHGGNSYIYGQYSKPCQAYLSDYCAQGWDAFCETASKNVNISFPNQLELKRNLSSGISAGSAVGMTAGDILIRNTAAKKYLVSMEGNCVQKFQPFDPTVANSPMISYWESEFGADYACVPYYSVDPSTIDNDPVMNKILEKPSIAFDILLNIYRTMKNKGTLGSLTGTRLGHYFSAYFETKESFSPGPTMRVSSTTPSCTSYSMAKTPSLPSVGPPTPMPTYIPQPTPTQQYPPPQPFIATTSPIPYQYSY